MITREIDTMREATERWSQEMQGLQRGMLARYKWAMVGIGVCWLI
jgi:hypothetical protein